MRFQALMPDILHWLGIKKIDRMLSMSNMKHDAIVAQGIKIIERIPIPDGISRFLFCTEHSDFADAGFS
jgi:GTP cyclohydrolase II